MKTTTDTAEPIGDTPEAEVPSVDIDDTIGILAINMADTPAVDIFKALEELFGMTEPPKVD